MTIDLSSADIAGAVAALPPWEFGFLAAFLALLALGSFAAAFRSLRRARLIEDVPTSKIRSAHQGYVELEGYAMPHQVHGALRSPLDGRSCVWWQYEVEERRSGGKGSDRWVTVDKGASKASFLVEDDTGSCVIRPERADLRVEMNRTWYGASLRPVPGAAGGSMLGRYRYNESLILAGERLYALGRFTSEHDETTDCTIHTLDKPSDGSLYLLSTQPQCHLVSSLRSGASHAFAAFLASGAGMAWLLAVRGIF